MSHKIFKAEPILGKRLVGLMVTDVPEVLGLHRLYLVMDDNSSLEIYSSQRLKLSYILEGRGMERLRQLESGPRSEIEWVDGKVTINHAYGCQPPPTSMAPAPVVPTPTKPPPPTPGPKAGSILGKRLVGLMATEVPEVPELHRLYLVMDDDSSQEICSSQHFKLSYVSEGRGMERLRQSESGSRLEMEWVDGKVTVNHAHGRQPPPTSRAPAPVVPTPTKPPPPAPVSSQAKAPSPVLKRGSALPPPETDPSTAYLNHLLLEGIVFYAMIKGIQLFFKCFPC